MKTCVRSFLPAIEASNFLPTPVLEDSGKSRSERGLKRHPVAVAALLFCLRIAIPATAAADFVTVYPSLSGNTGAAAWTRCCMAANFSSDANGASVADSLPQSTFVQSMIGLSNMGVSISADHTLVEATFSMTNAADTWTVNQAGSGSGLLGFWVDRPTDYSLSGSFTATNFFGTHTLESYILNEDASALTYVALAAETVTTSFSVATSTLTLAASAFLDGSLVGTLEPGVFYNFGYKALLHNSNSVTAAGNGFVRLELTPLGGAPTFAAARLVPGPSTVDLLGGLSSPGGLQASIDTGGLAQTLAVNYKTVATGEIAAELPEGTTLLSLLPPNPGGQTQIWDVSYTGTIPLGNPATLILTYDDTNLGGSEESIQLYHFNGSAWDLVTILSQDNSANTLTIEATSFSPFVVLSSPNAAVPGVGTLGLGALILGMAVGGAVRIRRITLV